MEFVKNSIQSSDSCKNSKKARRGRKCVGDIASSSTRRNPMAPKRKKSSEKERERNEEIKTKLQYLAGRIPFVQKDLSRIRTLRLTKEYITHLIRILHGETVTCPHTGTKRPLSKDDFRQIVNRELQTNNSYKDRAETELSTVYSTASPSSGCASRLSYMANCDSSPQSSSENYRDDGKINSVSSGVQSAISTAMTASVQSCNFGLNEYLLGSGCILRRNVLKEESPMGPIYVPPSTHACTNIIANDDRKYITGRVADQLPLLQTYPATSTNVFETPRMQYHLANSSNSAEYCHFY